MLIFKRNQIVISSLIIVIVCAGYLNYKYNQTKLTSTDSDTPIGAAYFVENTGIDEESEEVDLPVAKINGDYFIVTRAERETTRDEQKELLQSIIDNKNTDKESKTKAESELIQIAKDAQKEVTIEGILKGKGFADILAFINEGKADIIVKDVKTILPSQQAMILDVVMRETGISADNIKISPYKPATPEPTADAKPDKLEAPTPAADTKTE